MGQDQSSEYATRSDSRSDKLLFHTAFNRGIPVTGYLGRDDMMALSNVSRMSRQSVRNVLEKRGITLFHTNETDPSLTEPKVWTVTLHYTGQDRTDFFNILVRDKYSLLEYINANTFIMDIRQTTLDELELTFACDAVDFRKKEVDEDYLATKIRDSIERQQDYSPDYYSLFVKDVTHVTHVKPNKEGRRSKQKKR
jgi:hypothetical protein